jgi:hypothetical protein
MLLGCHVLWRAENRSRLCQRGVQNLPRDLRLLQYRAALGARVGVVAVRSREPEVQHANAPIVSNEDIPRLEVAVN